MDSETNDIAEIFDDPNFKKLKSHGLIDEIALRNFNIKSEYRLLRKTHSQVDSIFKLMNKYNLSFDSINTILFRKRIIKRPTPGVENTR